MTIPAPSTVEPPRDLRPRRRRRLILLLVVAALASLGGWMYQRTNERTRVLAAIEAAGGKWHKPTGPSYFDRVLASMFGASVEDRRYDVWLNGTEVNDAWLEANHDLRSVPIEQLSITDTQLSRDAVMRLLNQNRLMCFNVSSIPLTDADAKLIGDEDGLTHLNLMQTGITDAGFAALQPQRLIAINVAGTRVTPAALRSGLTGSRHQYIGVDGRQFTPELAAQLAQMKTVNMISLVGPDVTDAHVKLLEAMPNLVSIGIDQTSASDAAVAALNAANPKAQINVYDENTAFFKWRR